MIRRRLGALARSGMWWTADAVASRSASHHRSDVDSRSIIILPPADGGSLGDDAMVLGLLHLIGSREVVLVPYQAPGYGSLVGRREAPDLTGRAGGLAFLPLLRDSAETYIIGADVLDGFYSDRKTTLRLRFANLAARSGSRTSVVGFSMNANPSTAACAAISGLDPRVRLVARDPISAQRTEAIAGRPVETAADLAFLVEAEEPPAAFALPAEINVGFAPNYHLAGEFGGPEQLLDAMEGCLSALLASGPELGIVLIPHDSRGPSSDFALSASLAERLPSDRVVAATFVSSPGHVRWVAAQLHAMVSARMHAAIGALGEGTPVAVLGYQNKAEGILSMFELDHWVAHPQVTLSNPSEFVALAQRLLDKGDEIRPQIHRLLPAVIAAARRNVI